MRHLHMVLAAALFLGCQGSSDSMSMPDLATSPDLATPTTVAWTTYVIDIQSRQPLTGVNVCIAPDNVVCATTDSTGNAKFSVPMSAQFMLSYTLANYATQFTEHGSSTTADGNTYLLVSTSTKGALAGAVGQSIDNSKGNLVFSAIDSNSMPLAGVKFTVTPTGGAGPYYFGSTGFPDSTATMTTSNGLSFVLNLPAGDFDVTAALTGKTCAGSFNKSWPGTTASSVKARSVAGGITTISMVCK